VALRVELATGNQQVNPLLQSEMLAALGKVIQIDSRGLERLEVSHPDLALLHIVTVR
jgi:hypothetical protein